MTLILRRDLFILFGNNQNLSQVGKMLGSRLPKARQFSHTPHYYNPKKDGETGQGNQIKFQRRSTKSTARARSLVWLLFLLALAVYLIIFLNRLSHSQP